MSLGDFAIIFQNTSIYLLYYYIDFIVNFSQNSQELFFV